MELRVNYQEDCYLKKHQFNLKTLRSDGLILQIHNSYSNSEGESKRFRFTNASFNHQGTLLAVSDHRGHVFIINLETERYWQLPEIGVPTLISFLVDRKQELLIGLENTSVFFIHIETGNITGALHGHCVPATEVSYSDDGYYYLTSSSAEAIVWESSSYIQIHRLSLKSDVFLKKVLFMPVTNHILACFQDDTMHIWKFGSFECIKQIVPETWKTHHLKSIAITRNGRAMVIGGQSSSLVIFCLDTWAVKKVIECPENISGVKQLEFLSQVFDGGANKILVVLTISQSLFFFDIEALVFLKWVNQIDGLAVKFSLSSNGKYLANILSSGGINIYTVEKVLWSKRDITELDTLNQSSGSRNNSSSSRRTQKTYQSLSSVQRQIKEVLDLKKLLPILKQFGEYPQSYRTLIWKTILQLPENQESFVSLSLKKCHPSYSKLELKYPLTNKSLCNSLKKLLSNLSHWCLLFGEVDFLPEFVFPFVKLFHPNPLICFEVVATIIVNWCQNWFEFYPFPPINLLSLLESILGYHDPDLLEFYFNNNITSSISFCPLFHTAFSEVLSKAEWLKLWDHILSNEPCFFFMAIIAYNVVCQNLVRSLPDATEVEKFFHTQTPIDLKMLIRKTYQYLRETPEDIHIRQFFTPFRSLGSGGTYISFLAYPKLIIDSNAEKLQAIRQKEDKILDEQFKALNIRNNLEKKATECSTAEDKEKIYRELEEKIRKVVEEEEDRLLTERQKLQNLRQELKLKELEILENTRDKVLKEKIERKEMEFKRLLRDISKRRNRNKFEIETMEREIRSYYSDLFLRKCQLELELGLANNENQVDENLNLERDKLMNDLTNLQYEWDNSYHDQRIDVCNKIAIIKSMICDVETEIAKQMVQSNFEMHLKDDKIYLEDLKKKVNTLEGEIEKLLKKNLDILRNQKEQQVPVELGLATKPEHLRKHDTKNKTTKPEAKNTTIAETRKSVKYATKKISSGNKGVAGKSSSTIASQLPNTKKKDLRDEKIWIDLNPEDWENFVKAATSGLTSAKARSPHLKSKFTRPTEMQSFAPDLPCNSEGCDSLIKRAENCEGKKFHGQPKGDFSNEGHNPVSKNVKSKNKENATKPKNDEVLTDSADEIFKSTFKIRNEIIENAKNQQSHGLK